MPDGFGLRLREILCGVSQDIQHLASSLEIVRHHHAGELRLRGVGPAVAERLSRLGIVQPLDLLFLLPQRYEDRTRVVPLGSLRPGLRVVVEGEVALADVAFRRRRSLLVRLADRTGQLTLRFFHFSRTQQDNLVAGARLRCYGEVRTGQLGNEMVHPEYRVLAPGPVSRSTSCRTTRCR